AGYTRLVGPAGAGLLRMPYRRWAPADHFGAALWIGSHIGGGYALGLAGVNFDTTDKYFKVIEWALLAAVVALFAYLYSSGWQKIRGLVEHGEKSLDDRDRLAEVGRD